MALSVGFVGLGTMGAPLAAHLIESHGQLTVYDIDSAPCEALATTGAQIAQDLPAIWSACDVVFTSLPTPGIFEEVATGSDGVAQGDRCRTIVDLSTNGPLVSRAVGIALAARGVDLVDAPVTGGPARARSGELAAYLSGRREAVDAVLPLIRSFAPRIFRIGHEPGQAQAVNVINNALSAIALAASGEALAGMTRLGLDPAVTFEAINHGSGRNSATLEKIPRHVLTGTFDYGFPASGTVKDLDACLEVARSVGLDLPLIAHCRDHFAETSRRFGAQADMTTVTRLPLERGG
jgi:3-hydroxyisobutyrate dehydrogenase-like beta-hydroxyacid dehydrogenase